jgi:hypothetical protein
MDKGKVGEESKGKETDECPLTATGNVMSEQVLVAAYMSDLIPCCYGTSSMSCISECMEGDWSVDRIVPAVMGI